MRTILITGGNIGNRSKYLDQAAKLIQDRCGDLIRLSSLYETAAWGKTNQQSFLNQVLIIDTAQSAGDLMQELLLIEIKMGRVREEKNGPRKIDIDILFYEDKIIEEPNLVIPHPRIADRRFVLEPLVELVPEMVHPVTKKTISRMLEECSDPLAVNKL